MYSRFQSPGFQISQLKSPRIPNSTSKNIPDSGISYVKPPVEKNNLKDGYPIPGRKKTVTRVHNSRVTRSFLDEFPKILSHVGFLSGERLRETLAIMGT